MAMPVFSDEFRRCQVPPTYKYQVPPYPKMQGNKLTCLHSGDWKFEGAVVYPSGRQKYWSILLPPGQESATMEILHSEGFWRNLWETLIVCMHGEGEGLNSGNTTRH